MAQLHHFGTQSSYFGMTLA